MILRVFPGRGEVSAPPRRNLTLHRRGTYESLARALRISWIGGRDQQDREAHAQDALGRDVGDQGAGDRR